MSRGRDPLKEGWKGGGRGWGEGGPDLGRRGGGGGGGGGERERERERKCWKDGGRGGGPDSGRRGRRESVKGEGPTEGRLEGRGKGWGTRLGKEGDERKCQGRGTWERFWNSPQLSFILLSYQYILVSYQCILLYNEASKQYWSELAGYSRIQARLGVLIRF